MGSADQQVGITLTVKDKVSKTVRRLAGGFNSMGRSAGGMLKNVGKRLAGLRLSIVALNSGLEILSKAWNFLGGAVRKAIDSSIEFRGSEDKMIRKFTESKDTLDSYAAKLGDSIIPAILGVGIAIDKVIPKGEDWLETNRELITLRIIEWAMKFSRILVFSLSRAINTVNLGLGGAKIILTVLKGMISGLVGTALKLFGKVIKVSGKVSALFGNLFGGKQVAEFGEKIEKLGADILLVGAKAFVSLGDQAKGMHDLQESLIGTADEVIKVSHEVEKLAKKEAVKILVELAPTKKNKAEERLRIFEKSLAKWAISVRKKYKEAFDKPTKDNVEALDVLAQKLGHLGAEVGSFGKQDIPRLVEKARELNVISKEMAFQLKADPEIFEAGMAKAVGIASASVGEIKGQLALLEGAFERLKGVIDTKYGGAIRAVGAEAFNLFKTNEALVDMEAAQLKDFTRLKMELNKKVQDGEITAAEMKAELDQTTHNNRLEMVSAEEEAYKALYRGIRDQLIASGTEYVIQEGIKVAAKKAAEKLKTKAAVEGEAIRSGVATVGATESIAKSGAEGSAKAISAYAGIPGVGVALGLAAAAVVMGAISKYMGMWADGGYVSGGTRGKDSVPALLMPGEYVLNTDQVEMWKRLSLSMATGPKPLDGAYADGGFVRRGGGVPSGSPSNGGPSQVSLSFESNQLPNRAETKRWVRSTLAPALKELNQQGMMVGV